MRNALTELAKVLHTKFKETEFNCEGQELPKFMGKTRWEISIAWENGPPSEIVMVSVGCLPLLNNCLLKYKRTVIRDPVNEFKA